MNCETFHDGLLDLLSGKLGAQERRALLEHASDCPDCEAVLGVEESLQVWRDQGVVSKVPDSLVNSMWPSVQANLQPNVYRSPTPRPSRSGIRIAGGAIAALLLVGIGYLIGTVGAETAKGPVSGPVTRTSAPAEFASTSEFAPAEILTELENLPDEATLITAEEARMLLRKSAQVRRWATAVSGIVDSSDGVQVGEVRALVATLPADGGTVLPTALGPEELRRWLKRRV
jgi:hypothetical protein